MGTARIDWWPHENVYLIPIYGPRTFFKENNGCYVTKIFAHLRELHQNLGLGWDCRICLGYFNIPDSHV